MKHARQFLSSKCYYIIWFLLYAVTAFAVLVFDIYAGLMFFNVAALVYIIALFFIARKTGWSSQSKDGFKLGGALSNEYLPPSQLTTQEDNNTVPKRSYLLFDFENIISNYGAMPFSMFHFVMLLFFDSLIFVILYYSSIHMNYGFGIIKDDTLDFARLSAIGCFVGGILGPPMALISALLIFVTLRQQTRQIADSQIALQDSKFSETFFFLIKHHNELVEKLSRLIPVGETMSSNNFFKYFLKYKKDIQGHLASSQTIRSATRGDKFFILYEIMTEEAKDNDQESENLSRALNKFDEHRTSLQIELDPQKLEKAISKKAYTLLHAKHAFLLNQYFAVASLIHGLLNLNVTDNSYCPPNIVDYRNLYYSQLSSAEVDFIKTALEAEETSLKAISTQLKTPFNSKAQV